jgi:hypothetical protein
MKYETFDSDWYVKEMPLDELPRFLLMLRHMTELAEERLRATVKKPVGRQPVSTITSKREVNRA